MPDVQVLVFIDGKPVNIKVGQFLGGGGNHDLLHDHTANCYATRIHSVFQNVRNCLVSSVKAKAVHSYV